MKLNSPKKILFLIQLPPPVHGVSMINEILINNDELCKIYKINIINLATSKSISGIGKISPSKIYNSLTILVKLIKACVLYRPDLVYITFSPSGPAFVRDVILCLVPKLLKMKLLIHLHGKGLINLNLRSIKGRLAFFVFQNSYVICLSEGLKEDIKQLTPLKVFTLANGIAQNDLYLDAKKEGGKINLLYLSNLVQTKGIIDLIDALAIVKESHHEWQLSVVGNEGDITFNELNSYIERKGLKNYVTVHGPKYGESKSKELTLADVFVFPTYFECFPLVLLEAMQYKLCVITTYEGAIPEIITHNKTGLLFNQRNINELADCINEVILNRKKMSELAFNAHLEFIENYTSTIMNRRFMQILSRLI